MLRTEKRMACEEEGGRKDGTRVGKELWNLVGVTQIYGTGQTACILAVSRAARSSSRNLQPGCKCQRLSPNTGRNSEFQIAIDAPLPAWLVSTCGFPL